MIILADSKPDFVTTDEVKIVIMIWVNASVRVKAERSKRILKVKQWAAVRDFVE